MFLLLQPIQARCPVGFVALPSTLHQPAVCSLKYHTGSSCSWGSKLWSHRLEGKKGRHVPSHFSSFTYLPNNFLIPLAFFLESGEGGVICRLSISFGRGGKPARSKWSADPFSVSAIRKQKPHQDSFAQDCTDTLLNLGTTLAKITESHHVKTVGQRGMGKSRRNNTCYSSMGLTGNTLRQHSAPIKCLASTVGKKYLVNQSMN